MVGTLFCEIIVALGSQERESLLILGFDIVGNMQVLQNLLSDALEHRCGNLPALV